MASGKKRNGNVASGKKTKCQYGFTDNYNYFNNVYCVRSPMRERIEDTYGNQKPKVKKD